MRKYSYCDLNEFIFCMHIFIVNPIFICKFLYKFFVAMCAIKLHKFSILFSVADYIFMVNIQKAYHFLKYAFSLGGAVPGDRDYSHDALRYGCLPN